MFHPQYTYINKKVKDFTARPLLKDIFVDGEQVYDLPSLNEIKQYLLFVIYLFDKYVKRVILLIK